MKMVKALTVLVVTALIITPNLTMAKTTDEASGKNKYVYVINKSKKAKLHQLIC